MFARKEIKEENDIIVAKALPTTKPRKFAQKPNEFVTNDDFCPNCGLTLRSLAIEENNLWTDVFQRDLQDGFDPEDITMTPDEFVLGRSGKWLSVGFFYQMPVPERRSELGTTLRVAAVWQHDPKLGTR